jgi:hypothetical protein
VSVYVSRILSCAQKLRPMNDPVNDSDLLYSLLNGLPEEYDSFNAMIRLKEDVTFADAVKYLKDQYELSVLRDVQSANAAFFGKHGITNKGGQSGFKGRSEQQKSNKTSNNFNRSGFNKNKGVGKSGRQHDPDAYCNLHKAHC